MHWVISYFTKDWPALGTLLKGRDTTLIRDGRIDHEALSDSHMAMDDLEEDLRQQGVDDPAKVKEARLERSGKLLVLRDAERERCRASSTAGSGTPATADGECATHRSPTTNSR